MTPEVVPTLREARTNRTEWAAGLDVKTFIEGMEILHCPGCYFTYDTRMKKVSRPSAMNRELRSRTLPKSSRK